MIKLWLGVVSVLWFGCAGEATQEPPRSLDEIRALYESKTEDESRVVSILVEELRKRIIVNEESDRPVQWKNPNDCATIVRMIALRPYPAKPRGRTEPIEKYLSGSGPNPRPVEALLQVALALSTSSDYRRAEVVGLLEDPGLPRELVALVLDALQPQMPIEALPRLLLLADDPWSWVHSQDVGPPSEEREFPIRERVFTGLTQLGIPCEKIRTGDDVEESETVIRIDRAGLVKTLRAWILDEDPKVWQPACKVARELPGDDVRKMTRDLVEGGELTPAKKRLLT